MGICLEVPGSKSTKYKKERDLVGLAGQRLCLFKAEADVEDEICISIRQCFGSGSRGLKKI